VLQDYIAPATFGVVALLADACIEYFHPALFVSTCISVEIDDLAIVETDSEALFNEHVAFFFLCKARLPPFSAFGACLFLRKSTSVINELGSICKVNGCSWLTS
jgi:hypothetical protein